MDHGKIVARGSPVDLVTEKFSNFQLHLPLTALVNKSIDLSYQEQGDHIVIYTQNVDATIRQLIQWDVSLEGLSIQEHNLEDLFLQLTGHQLRD
jgi:ABC-2 type transport system ATP-binding protein